MNADLKNALEAVQKHFPEAIVSGNVVEVLVELIADVKLDNIINLKSETISPWIFRSGNGLKIVFYVKESKSIATNPVVWPKKVKKAMKKHEYVASFIDYCEKEHGINIPDGVYESFLDA